MMSQSLLFVYCDSLTKVLMDFNYSTDDDKNKYCVYFHKRKTDGTVFYIGSGVQNKREFHFSSRGSAWNKVKDCHGVVVEVYEKNLSKNEARKIEDELISSGKFTEIVNTNKVCKEYKGFSKEDLFDLIEYDEKSETYLSWTSKQTAARAKNKKAGSLLFDKNGKPEGGTVKILGKSRQINRVVWVLNNGSIADDLVVDHIDGNRHNNNINNLRAITIAENSRNRKSCSTKSSKDLPCGVFEDKFNFSAMISKDCKLKSVSFSKQKYGYEVAKQKAISWRSHMIILLNENGANYSARHFDTNTEDIDFSHKSCSYLGVSNTAVKRNQDGGPSSYEVYFTFNGKQHSKSYSVKKYGDEEAKRLAIDFATKESYTESDTLHNSNVKIEVKTLTGDIVGEFKSAADVSRFLGVPVRKVYKVIYREVKKNLTNKEGIEVILSRV